MNDERRGILNINVNPKYDIGQKIQEQVYINNEELVYAKDLIVNNIHGIYDFLTNKIEYVYQLKCDDEDGFIYGWFKL